MNTLLVSTQHPQDGAYPGATFLRCPDPGSGAALVSFLNDHVARHGRRVIVPASDDFVVFLARYGQLLDSRFLFLQPSRSVVEALDDKVLFHDLCRSAGAHQPFTLIPRDMRELESQLPTLPFPCIVKPPKSKDWQGLAGYKIQRATSREGLRNLCSLLWSAGKSLLIQEEIPGGPDSIYFVGGFYDEHFRPEKVFVGQKLLQHPLNIGSTCLATLVTNDRVLDAANKFAAVVGIAGLVDIEFKYDRRDDHYKMIEVNPRNGLWHRISDDGSWDITSYYVHRLLERTVPGFAAHAEGRRWIHPVRCLLSRVEQFGLMQGARRFVSDVAGSSVRSSWDPTDVRRLLRSLQTIVGYMRYLGARRLMFGGPTPGETDVTVSQTRSLGDP